MCAQFGEHSRVQRQSNNKWQLSRQEYLYDTYPAYCSGLAYLAPAVLLRRLLQLAQLDLWDESTRTYRRPLWVDDVYITGILLASLADKARVHRLNAHFCYTRAQQSSRGHDCVVSEGLNDTYANEGVTYLH